MIGGKDIARLQTPWVRRAACVMRGCRSRTLLRRNIDRAEEADSLDFPQHFLRLADHAPRAVQRGTRKDLRPLHRTSYTPIRASMRWRMAPVRIGI